MELRHLRYFVAAVEEGSLQSAATRVHVAQSALSRRIRDLEASVGCTLFERSKRGVVPTKAGIVFYREVVKLLDGLTEVTELVRSMERKQGGETHLGLVQMSRRYNFLHSALSSFGRENPNSTIDLTHDSSPRLADALREKRLDLSFLYEGYSPPGFQQRQIHEEQLVLAVHPDNPLAVEQPLEISELSGSPLIWLTLRGSTDYHSALMQRMRLQGIDPIIEHSAVSFDEMIDLTYTSGGACVTAAMTKLLIPDGSLVFRPIPDLKVGLHLSLAWRPDLEEATGCKLLRHLLAAIDRYQAEIAEDRGGWTWLHGHKVVSLPT